MSTTTPAVTTKPTPAHAAKKAKPQLSEGARAERRLGFLLIAPQSQSCEFATLP